MLEYIEEPEDLTTERLMALQTQYKPKLILIEYNGTWKLEQLFELNVPKGWTVVQIVANVDASSFESYLNNMRAMMMEQVSMANLVIFNRCTEETKRGEYRRIIKANNRMATIVFEKEDGSTEFENSDDDLPYKLNADVIEIEDDGAGLNYSKILNKAIEKGLASSDKRYSDEEIANFIFLPGFSTADQVDSVSGRGVGMDVVRTDITKVGGTVRVDTIPGQGTKFTLKIPINLAILNGTIVKIAGQTYILPTLNIREIISISDENWISVKGNVSMLKFRGEVLPIYPIRSLLNDNGFGSVEDSEYDETLMVITELDDMVRAIPVQSILERREIVVKSLGSEFANLDFISGASILGDGTISLIFDIEGLFKKNVV